MMYDLRNKAKRVYNDEPDEPDNEEYIFGDIDINNLNNNAEIMNKFKESELIGRKYCKSWLDEVGAINVEFTKDKWDVVDVCFEYSNKSIAAEIKVRDEKYRKYKTHFMELNKLINVTNYVDKNNKDGALYMNFFGENWLYIYKVSQISTNNIKNWNLVVTTAEDNGSKMKDIIEIPTNLAQIYNRLNKESQWKRVK